MNGLFLCAKRMHNTFAKLNTKIFWFSFCIRGVWTIHEPSFHQLVGNKSFLMWQAPTEPVCIGFKRRTSDQSYWFKSFEVRKTISFNSSLTKHFQSRIGCWYHVSVAHVTTLLPCFLLIICSCVRSQQTECAVRSARVANCTRWWLTLAECFSDHLCDISRKLHKRIQAVNDLPVQYVNRTKTSFVYFPITESDFVWTYSKMKSQKRLHWRSSLFHP